MLVNGGEGMRRGSDVLVFGGEGLRRSCKALVFGGEDLRRGCEALVFGGEGLHQGCKVSPLHLTSKATGCVEANDTNGNTGCAPL